jgi:4-hydroxythreonine-4-phosphate dehydrogenase
MFTFVFTCGDINGIGPEISLKAFNQIFEKKQHKQVFVCPANVFKSTADVVKPNFKWEIIKPVEKISNDTETLTVVDIGKYTQNKGFPTAESGKSSYEALQKALSLVGNKTADAIITSPISKLAFQKAGIKFPGHTELLADYAGVDNFAMLFVSEVMKAGLITIHEPVGIISSLITRKKVAEKLRVIISSLKTDFGKSDPRVAVLGLNPHAGEEGNIGREEEEVIRPALEEFADENIQGPFVPDAFFANHKYNDYDIVIGMYHDQVLIPFKMLSFNKGVNFTAGLPFVRTSPDHGTAYDIAGQNLADHSSLLESYKYAELVLENRSYG